VEQRLAWLLLDVFGERNPVERKTGKTGENRGKPVSHLFLIIERLKESGLTL
jgi:hypothetical protein